MDDTLYFNSVNSSDSGKYCCKARNELGEDERSLDLEVLHPPINQATEGVDLLEELSVPFNESLELTFDVVANPEPSVDWYKRKFEEKVFKFLQRTNGTTLKLPGSNSDLDGEYKAVVKNEFGSIEKLFKLKGFLKAPPSFIIPNNADLEVVKGENVTLSFDPLIWDDTMEIIWDFVFDDNVKIDGNKLVIVNATSDNIRTYSGTIKNKYGENSLSYTLDVLSKPEIREIMVNGKLAETSKIIVKENSTLEITCPAESKPDFEMKWTKDGQSLDDDDRV